jgi:hypothetical protein
MADQKEENEANIEGSRSEYGFVKDSFPGGEF